MSIELLLLILLGGITLLAYMVAINSHGPTRLSISYLLATALLATSVWAVVQHVNMGEDRIAQDKLRREAQMRQELEKQKAEAVEALQESRDRAAFAAKLNTVINTATGLATTMMNVDLRDMSLELDALIGKATTTRAQVREAREKFEALKTNDRFFEESLRLMSEAMENLNDASQYFYLYYRSEDSAQEELRERIMRQKARDAYEKCQKASGQIASVH